jgi:predicted transcriptional regulator
MDTTNTVTAPRGRMALAINKLELLNKDEGKPILSYLVRQVNASLLDIILSTGLKETVVEDYLEELLQNGFVSKEQNAVQALYSLDRPYFQKIMLVANKLAGFWQ